MVEHHVCAHHLHDLIKALGGELLEKGIRFPGIPHAVDHVISGIVLVHHLVNGIDIVLEVGIQGNCHVAVILHCHQAAQQRILVSPVPGQAHALVNGILLVQRLDDLPGAVLRAVVDKDDAALLRDLLRRHQRLYFRQKLF